MNTEEIAARVRDAHGAKRGLRIVGGGTWLSAGRPVASQETLSIAECTGIVEYVPGDLTLTARAGTRLAEIDAATASAGQWLPLDPWGGDAGTLGATLSTATAGPHAHAMGLPRDVVLGIEFVSGAGRVVRAGGRVVKNVAGFDLTRMTIGAWGTLGVITEATVRLRARPEVTRTLAVVVEPRQGALSQLATALRALPFTPIASELLNARFASRLGLHDDVTLLVRAGGNEKSVDAQMQTLRTFGESDDVDEGIWNALRVAEPDNCAAWRWSQLPSVFGETWGAADRATRVLADALVHGNPARGVVRVIVGSASKLNGAEFTRTVRSFPGTVSVERLPADAWLHVDAGAAHDAVSRSIRQTFDPAGILNPGILGEDT